MGKVAVRRRKTLIWHEEMGKTEKIVDGPNLTRTSRLCYHHFNKKQVSTDGDMSGGPVNFDWNI